MPRFPRLLPVVGVLAMVISRPSLAQNGWVEVRFTGSAAETQRHAVMVSLLQDSGVVRQGETVVPTDRRFVDVAAGVYDVRVEGAGVVTQVKRGVHLVAGQTLDLQFVLRPGTGADVTRYAAAVLSREEIEARLRRLEAAVDSLRHAPARGTGRPD